MSNNSGLINNKDDKTENLAVHTEKFKSNVDNKIYQRWFDILNSMQC